MPSQAYFEVDGEGDWYACIATAAPGESPGTNPEKWVKMAIPYEFERFLVLQSTAALLVGDGQHEKAGALRKEAADELEERLLFNCMRGEQPSPRVMTR